MDKDVQVFAPATVANVACGFDIFGFALENPGDQVIARLSSNPGVTITKIQGDGGVLPLEAEENTAGVSVLQLLKHLNTKQGIEIELIKELPLGSGLGSSAASAAASVYAANVLLGSPLEVKDLIPFAVEAERVACGSAHADNVAPALLGGFILVRSMDPLDIIKVPVKMELYCALLHPHVSVRTAEARAMLGKDVSLKKMVEQTGNAAGLIAALILKDYELLSRCLKDVIAEPVRSALIPGFTAIKEAAIQAGSLGCSISGSGPTLFALATSQENAIQAADSMRKACEQQGVQCDAFVSKINQEGPRVL